MLYTIKYILFRSYTYFLEAWNLFLPLNCLLILYLQKQTRKDNTFVCVQLRMCAYVHGFSYTHILNNTSTYCIFQNYCREKYCFLNLFCFILLIIRRQKDEPTENYDMKVKEPTQNMYLDGHEQCHKKSKKRSLSHVI